MTISMYDYDKRNWKKINNPEELSRLGTIYRYSSRRDKIIKPTVRVITLLKAASIPIEKDDDATKILRLITGNI